LVIIPPALVYCLYLKTGSEKRIREDPVYEALIEMVLIGTGIMALVWTVLT
jgi:hypothetical protein